MKIAVLAPSPIPFTIGGAEKLAWGLCDNINKKTSHQAELIKVPVKEDNFWNVIDSYYAFYNLDLSHFDVVVCSKYPAWMIRHPNCLYYVLHRLRGVYDTYNDSLNEEYPLIKGIDEHVDKVIKYMEDNKYPSDLDDFFRVLFEMKEKENEILVENFAFPGPLIRSIIHYMDNFGMSQNNPAKYFAISKTVKNRTEYFPTGAQVDVVYPPINLQESRAGEYNYVFTISRLDYAKRINVLIEAMKQVKSDIKLYIAGTGPQEEELKALAAGDSRIIFLGYVSDDDVEKYYEDCLVVPYFPEEEDYGLITIEAMKHKKPVITSKDSGGPTEFVVDGQTGYITDLSPQAIAEKIDTLVKAPQIAKQMGEKAFEKVSDIDWEHAVFTLTKAMQQEKDRKDNKRKKIVVTSSFPIWPPTNGGAARVYGLYEAVSHRCDVEVVSLTRNMYDDQKNFNEYFREFSVPHGPEMAIKILEIFKKLGLAGDDVALLEYDECFPSYVQRLQKSLKDADLLIVSQPYTWKLVQQALGNKPFVYEAANVEYILKQKMIPSSIYKEPVLKMIYNNEKECCEKSLFITACSETDKQDLIRVYNVPEEKIAIVPNGVNSRTTKYFDPEQRKVNKLKKGIGEEKIGLYIGSLHGPNIDGAEMILSIASSCPDSKFMLMGTQCENFKYRSLPENVGLLGRVNDSEKSEVMSTVDFALNPMYSGSGTNLKMFDYMSAGIPTISSNFGTRGIDRKDLFTIADTEQELIDAINNFDFSKEIERVEQARKYVEDTFEWRVIAENLERKIEQCLG